MAKHTRAQYIHQDAEPLPEKDGRALTYASDNPFFRLNRKSTGFSRGDIVNAFHTAFEMCGGVPRLALWADQNYGEFMKLHSKLLPSSSQIELGTDQKIVIEHTMPRSALDDRVGQRLAEYEDIEVRPAQPVPADPQDDVAT